MNFATPQEAEQAFYDAMSKASVDAMKEVWLNSSEIACIHPMSECINGYRLVIGSWLAIFQGQGDMTASAENMVVTQGPVLSIHTGIEVLHQDADEFRMQVTNAYQVTDDGWKMVLHHASPSHRPERKSRLDSRVH